MDRWKWLADSLGKFSVKSAYDVIQGSVVNSSDGENLFKHLWNVPVPSNQLAFAWRVLLDRVQTRDHLWKRQVLQNVDDTVCPLCNDGVENSDHLFFTCMLSWRVWMWIFNWLGITTVLPEKSQANFLQHPPFGGSVSARKAGRVIWVAAIRSIWEMRNSVVFKGDSFDHNQVLDLAQHKSWSWLRAKSKGFSFSPYEWHSNPLICLRSL